MWDVNIYCIKQLSVGGNLLCGDKQLIHWIGQEGVEGSSDKLVF